MNIHRTKVHKISNLTHNSTKKTPLLKKIGYHFYTNFISPHSIKKNEKNRLNYVSKIKNSLLILIKHNHFLGATNYHIVLNLH